MAFVLDAQCAIGTERYPETIINTENAKCKKSQAYGELVLYSGRLSKVNNLQSFLCKDDFRGIEKLSLFIFITRCQKHLSNTPKKF